MNKGILLIIILSQIVFLGFLPVLTELTLYLHYTVLLVLWFCYSSLVVFFIYLLKKEKITLSKEVFHALFTFYSLGLFILLFFRPSLHSERMYNLYPFNTIRYYMYEQQDFLISFYNISANIGLFIPFGIYYYYVSGKATMTKLLLTATGVIGLIECMQFFTRRGSLDIDDLLLNVIGVAFGYLISPFVKKVIVLKEM
ncbi:VanZ family protein [Lottiidibacillus patelloidae]|nr:VanZ family protein [Lottiidibacillus patelloidae]